MTVILSGKTYNGERVTLFSNTNYEKCAFINCLILAHNKFANKITFKSCTIVNCKMEDTLLTDTYLIQTIISTLEFNKVKFVDSKFTGCSINGCYYNDIDFNDVTITSCTFSTAKSIKNIRMTKVDIYGGYMDSTIKSKINGIAVKYLPLSDVFSDPLSPSNSKGSTSDMNSLNLLMQLRRKRDTVPLKPYNKHLRKPYVYSSEGV